MTNVKLETPHSFKTSGIMVPIHTQKPLEVWSGNVHRMKSIPAKMSTKNRCLPSFALYFFLGLRAASAWGQDFEDYAWTRVDRRAGWTRRAGLQVVELNDNIYLMGGRTPLPKLLPFPFPVRKLNLERRLDEQGSGGDLEENQRSTLGRLARSGVFPGGHRWPVHVCPGRAEFQTALGGPISSTTFGVVPREELGMPDRQCGVVCPSRAELPLFQWKTLCARGFGQRRCRHHRWASATDLL